MHRKGIFLERIILSLEQALFKSKYLSLQNALDRRCG